MILLAGVSVRALIESAVASGYTVTGLDFYGDADACWRGKTMSITQDFGLKPTVKNLLDVAKTIPCYAFIYTSGPENTPSELDFWERQGSLKGNGVLTLNEVRNPWRLKECLENIGAKMPVFCSANQWDYSDDGKKWLIKPLNRGGGHGIKELPVSIEKAKALISDLPQPRQNIVEEYIAGIPGSVTFLANGKEAWLLGTSRQLITRGGAGQHFLYSGNIVPLDLNGTISSRIFMKKILMSVTQLTKVFGLKGINTLDFIVNAEGVWILELNPRWSASVELIERVLGQRLFPYHLTACEGVDMTQTIQRLRAQPKRAALVYDHMTKCNRIPNFRGKQIVFSRNSNLITNYDGRKLRYLYLQGVRDLPRTGTLIEKGQPLCTVLAAGKSDQDCSQKLQAKAEWVQQFIAQNRLKTAR
ncbi:MAG: ATP-grasp domain-containing protein [Peptococcaceae bacterium]|nr:ATP-grasp domain-containing protein [Peptococcaceae bacterium]